MSVGVDIESCSPSSPPKRDGDQKIVPELQLRHFFCLVKIPQWNQELLRSLVVSNASDFALEYTGETEMRTILLRSTAGLAMLLAPSAAFAACNLADANAEQQLSQIEGINSAEYGGVRRDVRELRSAAMVLQRYGKDPACEQVVSAMNEILRDPGASATLRNGAMSPTTPAAPADGAAAPADGTTQAPAATGDQTAAVPPAQGMTMDQRRTGAVPLAERKAALSASELIGTDVYGPDNNSLGEIDDIVVSPDNTPAYALISYGGFLGMGEEQTAVPVNSIRFSEHNYAFVNFNADQLKAAPKFQRGTSDWWGNEQWRKDNDTYYNSLNQ
jgi:sporulation protein YlmC with PRC-barrel domain